MAMAPTTSSITVVGIRTDDAALNDKDGVGVCTFAAPDVLEASVEGIVLVVGCDALDAGVGVGELSCAGDAKLNVNDGATGTV